MKKIRKEKIGKLGQRRGGKNKLESETNKERKRERNKNKRKNKKMH